MTLRKWYEIIITVIFSSPDHPLNSLFNSEPFCGLFGPIDLRRVDYTLNVFLLLTFLSDLRWISIAHKTIKCLSSTPTSIRLICKINFCAIYFIELNLKPTLLHHITTQTCKSQSTKIHVTIQKLQIPNIVSYIYV